MKVPNKTPQLLSPQNTNHYQPPDSDLQQPKPHHSRRRRRGGLILSGRRTGPATPLLRWRFDAISVSDTKSVESGRRVRNSDGVWVSVSARKLAAGLWQFQKPHGGESGVSQKQRSEGSLGFKPCAGRVGDPFHTHHNRSEFGYDTNNLLQGHHSVTTPNDGMQSKVEPYSQFHNHAMEGVTKWDPVCSKTSDEVYRFYGQMKLLEDQQVSNASVVSSLQTDLEKARARIDYLETERRSSEKKLEHFLSKLSEEKAAWRSREHEKIRAIIDGVKDELKRERKNRHKMEIVNSKLVNELAEARLTAKRAMQEFEKERKGRVLMEEVCDELAKEIGEDKAEVVALKKDSMKMQEEVEEERRMLQMAEVWREERVQMKLVDAKLILESRYAQMTKLIADLEVFLSSRSVTPDVMEMRKADILLEAAGLVKIQDIKEFSYEPPNSEDIFSIIEDIQNAQNNEREIEQCNGYSPASHASKIHTVTPDCNGFNGNPVQRYSNGYYQSGEIEDDGSGWETVSQVEEQGSSYSPEGSNPSVSRYRRDSSFSGSRKDWEENPSVSRNRRDSSFSGSRKDWEENPGHDSPNTVISEVCSISSKQSKKKGSSLTKLWRSNGDNYKIISAEGMKGRLSNGRLSSVGTTSPDRGNRKSNAGIISPDCGSGEGGFSPQGLMPHWSSPDSGNPHITRGMKGCIERPRGAQKDSLKSKLWEARIESQKVQLRHVLKQKI